MLRQDVAAVSRILLLAVVAVAAVLAKEPLLQCGSYFTQAQEELFLHRRHAAQPVALRAAPRAARANVDVGEIAVIGSGKGVLGSRNPFDLTGSTLMFEPAGGGYAATYAPQESYNSAASTNGTRLTLGDDDFARVTLPFPFAFFGSTYTEAFVNANGTVTFTEGDRDFTGFFGHFAAGPPAIAALFTDLNPANSIDGVRYFSDAGGAVFTWSGVPLASSAAFVQTFQIRLRPQGRIEMTYLTNNANLAHAVTGITPGNGQLVELVDLSTVAGTFPNGVAESFTATSSQEVDIVAAAHRFYETHDDSYDYLVFYNAMGAAAAPGIVSYEVTTRSSGEGYGDIPVETGVEYGSARRLQAVLNMGPTNQFPLDPMGIVALRGSIQDTPLTLLAHEAGHLFLALVSVPSSSNSFYPPMLGSALAHWAFPFHTDASFLEGNRIVDQGPGVSPRFRTTATVQRYSPLDQYLMGMRLPHEVEPTFAVLNSGQSNAAAPRTGITFDGTRLDIGIEDIIQAAGRRTPDATVAQRQFRLGFVVIVEEDAAIGPGTPGAAAIAQVDAYRAAFGPFFASKTDFRGELITTLRRSVDWSLAPHGGVSLGGETTAVIRIEAPAAGPLSFAISAPSGVVTAPASVTIPAGKTEVAFAITGNRMGVEEMGAVPSDAAYHTAIARVPVRPRGELHLAILSGAEGPATGTTEPIRVRVADENKVPYSGQPLRAVAAGGGHVNQGSVLSNEFGEATFLWTTTATTAGFNSLTLSIDGVPGSAVTITVPGPPVILPAGIVNSATFYPAVAPNSFASIFGGSLAAGASVAAPNANFPTNLEGVRVRVNGAAARLSYVSDGIINFVVPANILPGVAQVEVETPLGISAPAGVPVVATAPGIFLNPVLNAPSVYIAGTATTTQSQPAKAGDFLAIYGTGFGNAGSVGVTVGGVAVDVTYAGPTVVPGLQQVNVRLPVGVPPGSQPLILTVNGIRANTVPVFHE